VLLLFLKETDLVGVNALFPRSERLGLVVSPLGGVVVVTTVEDLIMCNFKILK